MRLLISIIMAKYFSLLCVLTTLFVLSRGHPTAVEKVNNEIKCAEGEVLGTTGKCVKAAVPSPKPQLSPEEIAKRKELKKEKKQKKRTIKKKLDEEIKEIKRLVIEGLEKGTIEIKCPDGKEINEQGECAVEGTQIAADVPLDAKKAEKAKRMEKRLEKEMERLMKKEIQMEMKAKKRREQKKQKNLKKKEAGVNNAASKPGTADSMKAEVTDNILSEKLAAETKNVAEQKASNAAKEVADSAAKLEGLTP